MDELFKGRILIILALLLCAGVVLLAVFDAPDIRPAGVLYSDPAIQVSLSSVPAGLTAATSTTAAQQTAAESGATAPAAVFPLNLNTASKQELMLLDGVGDKLSDRIIQYRETHNGFDTIEEIMQVPGIGEKTFEKLRPYITVE